MATIKKFDNGMLKALFVYVMTRVDPVCFSVC